MRHPSSGLRPLQPIRRPQPSTLSGVRLAALFRRATGSPEETPFPGTDSHAFMRPRSVFVLLPLAMLAMLATVSCTRQSDRGAPWRSTTHDSSWIPFTWEGDSLGTRYHERAAIDVPVRIAGVPRSFTCQLDLGSNVSLLYGNPLRPFIERYPALHDRLEREKAWFIVWNHDHAFRDLPLMLGPVPVRAASIRLMEDYGAPPIDEESDNDTIPIGTLGADLVKGKIIIIDYPGRRLRILDTMPRDLDVEMVDIRISRNGFAVLPLRVGDSTWQVLFDTGSSIFQILTLAANTAKFSDGTPVDTVIISSWGRRHDVIGRRARGSIGIAGSRFDDVRVYSDSREGEESFYRAEGIDAITGNALFWERVIVIDYARGKFGIVRGAPR
jgi:hypothetical protein